MAKKAFTGYTGKIYIDPAGGSSWAQVLKVLNVQLPPRTKAIIDVTGMEETSVDERPGIEQSSPFSFEVIWDVSDAQDAALATAYGANTYCSFKGEFVDGSNTLTLTWYGYIVGLTPPAFGGSDAVRQQVQGIRKGAITEGVT